MKPWPWSWGEGGGEEIARGGGDCAAACQCLQSPVYVPLRACLTLPVSQSPVYAPFLPPSLPPPRLLDLEPVAVGGVAARAGLAPDAAVAYLPREG